MLKRFGVSMDEKLLDEFDETIRRKGYRNRSEAIRDLIREMLISEAVKENEFVYGTITFIYDHHVPGLVEKIMDAQHEHRDVVVSTTHLHIDDRNCLEAIIVKGKSQEIKKLADKLSSFRGVKNVKYTFTKPKV